MSSINGACDKPYHNWYLAGDTWRCRWCDIAKQEIAAIAKQEWT